VDLELSVDGPAGGDAVAGAGSSLLELVAGSKTKGGGGQQQQPQQQRGLAMATPSPSEAAKAARRLFLSLVTTALAPAAAAASGALRRLAELLQAAAAALSEAAKGAAAAGGDAARRAVQAPLALVGAAGRALQALMAEGAGGDVRGYSFPKDTAAFLGETGRRVGASVLQVAAGTAGHVGRAGQHVKCVLGLCMCVCVGGGGWVGWRVLVSVFFHALACARAYHPYTHTPSPIHTPFTFATIHTPGTTPSPPRRRSTRAGSRRGWPRVCRS
jgi:hypothetical protein